METKSLSGCQCAAGSGHRSLQYRPCFYGTTLRQCRTIRRLAHDDYHRYYIGLEQYKICKGGLIEGDLEIIAHQLRLPQVTNGAYGIAF